MTKFLNILTPEFYTFLAGNKEIYGQAVFAQINDASEKISNSTDKSDSLAVVLSGINTGVTTGATTGVGIYENQAKLVKSKDGIIRRSVKIRSIDSRLFSAVMGDLTAGLPSPLEDNVPHARKENLISLHPDAKMIVGDFQSNPLVFGTIVVVRKVGQEFHILDNITSPMIPNSHPSGDDGTMGEPVDPAKDNALEAKYGLKRRKGKYTGMLTQYHNKILFNGSLPSDMLGSPNKTFWEPKGSGGGKILVDYLPSFNAMAAAFYNNFGEKLASSGIRSFQQQIKNRKKSLPKSNGGTRSEAAKCKTLNQRGKGCGTAIPGRSNHGWGQAVDIRYPGTHKFIKTSTPYYKWLVKNAYEVGFLGMKWGHLGQKNTPLSSQTFEAWHWEPITGRVIKGI